MGVLIAPVWVPGFSCSVYRCGMRLVVNQLEAHLKRELAPIYVLSGEEPLQLMECADAIRKAAAARGFSERRVFEREQSHVWEQLAEESAALSLFAERKVLDLRLGNGKPGTEGAEVLARYAAAPPADTLLMVTTGKLDKATQNAQWFKALERAGVWVQVWELDPAQTLEFVTERLRRAGFQVEHAAARLLAERVEGNLLAAVQEVEKLALLHPPGPLSAEAIQAAVADSARYDPFEWVEAVLAGDAHRVLRILQGLRGEGVAETLILWALSRELRILADYLSLKESGANPEPALAGLWGKRKDIMLRAARRQPAAYWLALLAQASSIDLLNKGLRKGNIWDELLQLGLAAAGQPLLRPV